MKYNDIKLLVEEAVSPLQYTINPQSFPVSRRAYDLKAGDSVMLDGRPAVVNKIYWNNDEQTGNVLPIMSDTLISVNVDGIDRTVRFKELDRTGVKFHSKRSWLFGIGEPRNNTSSRQWRPTPPPLTDHIQVDTK